MPKSAEETASDRTRQTDNDGRGEEVVEEEEEAERMRGTAKGRGGPLIYHRYACACTTLSVSDYYYIPYILAGHKRVPIWRLAD